ncbi:eukaryotic translation initiation factor 3 subunit A [Entophlyctis sp. JEL0112]|nr:eukaryotic translation initiation factor 3 subunit A [Entophlyctis sp. JEL0112]
MTPQTESDSLTFVRTSADSVAIARDGSPMYTISGFSIRPPVHPIFYETGQVSLREMKLMFYTYRGVLNSISIASAQKADAPTVTCSLVLDPETYNKPLEHQRFVFEMTDPAIRFVTHDIANFHKGDEERCTKSMFAMPDGRKFRWIHYDDEVDQTGGVYSISLEVYGESEKSRWLKIASATVNAALFGPKPVKALFPRLVKGPEAGHEQFARMLLYDSDRGEFKWDAEAAVLRTALASLWTVWQEDALNADGRIKDVIKKRENNRVKQSNARELIAVNQIDTALDLLHEILMSKRSRASPLTVLEPIVLRFVELAVNLRKGKIVKEGLHQYKNISQNVSVSAIELVIKRFIDQAEAKVAEAQSKADKINLDNVDDLEALETPESIILSTVSGDASKDRTDREVVTPWLKFLWEAYRTALDILRNNSRLEVLYQSLASQSFKFCLKYSRKTEFRRVCEILRQHLTTTAKYAHQTHSINLSDPETLQRHLDTRFEQLNAATELELYQEAFRSVEDIHTLFIVSKKQPKPVMLANYYEKLARIFMVGENYLFHAAAFSRLYAIVRTNKNLPEEEHERMATTVMISALAIPIISSTKTRSTTADTDDSRPRDNRLTNLLRVSKPPTRESLLKEALSKPVFSHVRQEVRELYTALEVDFNPLSLARKVTPLVAALKAGGSAQREIVKYSRPLHQVMLTRLFQQLGQVYRCVTIESVAQLAAFPSLSPAAGTDADAAKPAFDETSVEKFVMNGCRNGEFGVRMNHIERTISFQNDLFAGAKSKVNQGSGQIATASEIMRSHLSTLAVRLNAAVHLINPNKVLDKQSAHADSMRAALESLEEERRLAAERVLLIQKRRELRDYEAAKRVRDEEARRQEQARRELEAEKIRMEEDMRKREAEKIAQIRAEREREEAIRLAERIAGDGKNKNIKEELLTLDSKTLMEKQVELLEQEKRDLASKSKQIAKKLDHTERAFRIAEAPKWEADYVEQKKVDKAYYIAIKNAKLEASKSRHGDDLKVKQRVLRMMPDYLSYRDKLEAARQKAYEAEVMEANTLIQEAKAKRIAEVRKIKQDELARKMKEEEARRQFLENERIRLAESARLAEEKAAREAAKKLEMEEHAKKLEEITRLQKEKEKAIEEKQRQREEAARAPRRPVPASSLVEEGPWRRRDPVATTPAESAPTSGSNSSGKYVPPSRRGQAPPDSGSRLSGFGDRRDDRPFTSGSSRPLAFGGNREGGWGGGSDRPPSGSGAFGDRSREDRDSGATGGWRSKQGAAGSGGSGSGGSSTGKYVPPNKRG